MSLGWLVECSSRLDMISIDEGIDIQNGRVTHLAGWRMGVSRPKVACTDLLSLAIDLISDGWGSRGRW